MCERSRSEASRLERDRKISKCHCYFLVEVKASGHARVFEIWVLKLFLGYARGKLTSDLGECDAKIKERDRKITKLTAEIRRLTALLGDRDSRLRKLTAELTKCDATIRLFTIELGERHTKIGELTADVGDCNRKLRKHAAELEERDVKIRENEAEISKCHFPCSLL
ncbi:uncharacterized protein VSU04_015951 [Chlamydotis macqueenii]